LRWPVRRKLYSATTEFQLDRAGVEQQSGCAISEHYTGSNYQCAWQRKSESDSKLESNSGAHCTAGPSGRERRQS
jgi:hypothetical protein